MNLTFIDLFAGIGGLSLPLHESGGECVYANDNNKYAIQTYEANFPTKVDRRSILFIHPTEIPYGDILLAGFPCQPFSIAGKGKGLEDSRGDPLIRKMLDIILHIKPKYCLLENVPGLLFKKNREAFDFIIENLNLEYKVHYKILDASKHGSIQRRKRLYFVCIRRDVKQDFTFPEPRKRKFLLLEILEKDINEKYFLSNKLWDGHQRRKQNHRSKGNGFGYNLYNKQSQDIATLSARYYKDGSEILIDEGRNTPRKLTPRECARLMGFPDSFKIVCSDTQAYKQFGNSVCINVIRELCYQVNQPAQCDMTDGM